MTYLLDTHTFLWLLRSPERVPSRVQAIAADRAETLVLSIATPWEIAIKVGIGKLEPANILDDLERIIAVGEYRVLETTVRQVVRAGRLANHHKDPFDRMLAAQALDLDIPLLSGDESFDRYGVRRVWN